MFAQAKCDHRCRKIFNATVAIEGMAHTGSLFGWFSRTDKLNPQHELVACSDNASEIERGILARIAANAAADINGEKGEKSLVGNY